MRLRMLRTIAVASFASLLLAGPPVLAQTAITPPGTGTLADPYLISELGHLAWMAGTAGASAGKLYVLVSDIDAAATATWNDAGTDANVAEGFRPIGTDAVPFMGEFDGQGHTIRGLTIRRRATEVGFFGHIGAGSAVRRLGLDDASVTGDSAVGALVGTNDSGTVEQCHATGAVTGKGSFSIIIGGLVGENTGTLRQCYASGTVTGEHYWVGGLVGSSDGGTIEHCYATGAVLGEWHVGGLAGASIGALVHCSATGAVTGQAWVGGLVGSGNGTLTNCYATGTVTGQTQVGGLVGSSYTALEDCYATGTVTGQTQVGGLVGANLGALTHCSATGTVIGESSVGGLVGMCDGTLAYCSAVGTVTGQTSVGGLVGRNDGTLTRCYATGAVAGGTYVGGLVAYIQAGTVVECYATGAVTGTSVAGGLAGFSRSWDAVTRCYWDMDRSGLTLSAGGEGRTTAQMRQQSTYVDWDFQAQWGIAPDWNDGYPFTPRPGFWRVRFLAVGNGEVVGATSQVVANGEDAMSVTAVSAYGFTFARWEEDGTTENPRTLTHVTSDMTLTATFREANARAANGAFRAKVAGAGRGLWDLTAAYSTTVKGNPLTLNLVHDPSGKLSGTATYTMAPYTPISMPIKGSVRGTRGSITMKGALKGADSGKTVTVALSLDLTVDTANQRLVGRLTGSFRSNSTTTPVDDPVLLDIPETMDGTWTLEFNLDQSGRKVTGTATLTLSNDVPHTFLVRGKTGANRTAVLSLAGDPSDPASMPISIRTTITPLEGGWARIESLAGRGYGQALGW